MSVNPNIETFKALNDFSTYTGKERKLLKVAKDKSGREYLKFVPAKELTLPERIASIAGKSTFNLKNILKVASDAARNMPDDKIGDKSRDEIIESTTAKLEEKVNAHYKNNLTQKSVVERINQITFLSHVKPIAELQKTFTKEVEDADDKSFLRGALSATPAYQALHMIWQSDCNECGLDNVFAEQIQKNSSALETLEALVTTLESSKNTRIQEVGKAISTAVDTRKTLTTVKDPAEFTVAVFLLRQTPRLTSQFSGEQSKHAMNLMKELQESANSYSSKNDMNDKHKALLDRLKVVLTGQ